MKPDFTVHDEGTLVILTPQNDFAEEWCEENLPEDATMWVQGYVIEHRYAHDIINALHDEGYILKLRGV